MTRDNTTIGESERWLSVLIGGMLGLSSLRRRDLGAGALFALAGAALMIRGITGGGSFFSSVQETVRSGLSAGASPSDATDEVDEASMESFPASDPPSWTPTGSGDAESEQGEDPSGG